VPIKPGAHYTMGGIRVDKTTASPVQGFYAALQSVFDIHHTGHGNAQSVSGYPILANLEGMKGELQ